ncbi:protein transporter Sec31 [Streptomyces chilikensis]|uniref:Protein transporter Sec31 n=1 Tax=Streptomyces chilikensis TaxID=1194079 RepID=A0ABV3EJD2_9ACTN
MKKPRKPRTVPVERSQLVPHTVNGRTELVLDRWTVEVPAPPRDWDHLVLTAATVITGALMVAAVVFSTASIGQLLDRQVPTFAAYAAAAAFDLPWLICLALEWHARYDPERAARPRQMGHVLLAVAMFAIAANAWHDGHKTVGIVSALVSALVKIVWTVVMRHHAHDLDDRTIQWVALQKAQAGAELATLTVERQLSRARAAAAAERAALGLPPAAPVAEVAPVVEQEPDEPEPEQAAAPATGPMTIKVAVQTAVDSGIKDPDAVLRYVRQVADANAKPDTVTRYLRAIA